MASTRVLPSPPPLPPTPRTAPPPAWTGWAAPLPPAFASASLAVRVIAPRASIVATSGGHHSDTSHTTPRASAANAKPPTPSTPLASVVHTMPPWSSALPDGNRRCGASGTLSSACSSSSAIPSSATHPSCALPPCRSAVVSSVARLQPFAAPVVGLDTAYPPRNAGLSSGKICDRLHKRPTIVHARRHRTRPSRASAACARTSASMSARLPSGHRSVPFAHATCSPSEVTGSPPTTLAGTACSPTSRRHQTASCACTYTRVPGAASSPPPARVWTGSMRTSATVAGVATRSARATPVKSSMYTCKYLLGAAAASPPLPPLRACAHRPRLRPPPRGLRGRLCLVERLLRRLRRRRHQRRHPLKPVWCVRPSEPQPHVDHDRRAPPLVPPNKALHPPLRLL
eukprot:484767-Pleurochrysis_carterae.AAC.2